MKKILGLDIGTNSIGWAVVSEAEKITEKSSILKTGVRIVSADSVRVQEFEQGRGESLNAVRRRARGARRNLQRFKLRRNQLINLLEENGFAAKGTFEKGEYSENVHALRSKAADGEQLTLWELGCVFLKINQKRGYLSNRKADNDAEETSKESSDYLKRISDIDDLLEQNQQTIGQYCHQEMLKGNRLKGVIFLRKTFLQEFNLIWEKQKVFYPNILTDDLKKNIRDRTIFYQRPLKSAKHLVAKCQFEPMLRVVSKSHPLFQEFRLWQQVNNLVVTNITLANEQGFSNLGERPLTEKERKMAVSYLQTVKSVKGGAFLKKALGLKANSYGLNYEDLKGNQTRASIADALQDFPALQYLLEFDSEGPLDEQPYFRIWHAIYSFETTDAIQKHLMDSFGLPKVAAIKLSRINLPADYGSLSGKAIKFILPYLKQGATYDKACLAVFENEDSKNALYKEAFDTKDLKNDRKLLDKLPLPAAGKLRNPVVEQVLCQMVNLVNAIISDPTLVTKEERDTGQFEIRVELARELKMTAKQRNDTQRRNNSNKKDNERIKDIIEGLGIKKPSRRDIQRYKLWEECGGVSPYTQQPMHPVPLSKLFDRNLYEIEHIIPKARYFDDSMSNKTLAETAVNKEKGKKTAYEYMRDRGQLAAFEKYVRDNQKFSRRKKELLLAEQVPTDFEARQINATQYIAKAAKNLLTDITYKVWITSGTVTSYLRTLWGIDDLLSDLNIDAYRSVGLTTKTTDKNGKSYENINEWGKRSDHRHHAIDALVVAFTSQAHIQALSSLNAQGQSGGGIQYVQGRKFDQPVEHFYSKAKEAIAEIFVSHKANKKIATKKINRIRKGKKVVFEQVTLVPRGQLHKETVYGKQKRQYKQVLDTKFSTDHLEYMVHEWQRTLVEARLAENKNNPRKAFKDYEESPIVYDGSKKLLEVTMFEELFTKRVELNPSFSAKNIAEILDSAIKDAVRLHFKKHGSDSKKAFSNLSEDPILFNEKPVRRVKIKAGLSDPTPLHEIDGKPVDYVQTGNNYAIAIYQDETGGLHEKVISFWEAVTAKRLGMPPVPEFWEEKKLWLHFSKNDMFLLGVNTQEVDILDPKNKTLLSNHLYRVQKITGLDYFFRKHTTPHVITTKEMKDLRDYLRLSSLNALKNENPIKVTIEISGKIKF